MLKLSNTYYLDLIWCCFTIYVWNVALDASKPVSGVKMAIIILILSWSWQIKEYLYIFGFGKLYPNKYCEAKISKKKRIDKFAGTLNAGTIISGMFLWFLNDRYSLFTMKRISISVIAEIFAYSLANQLVFDIFYGIAHYLSHKYFYRAHKPHHSAKADVTSLNMGKNHWSETLISCVFASVLPTIALFYFGIQWHVVSFWLHLAQKLSQHSANPYSPMLFFPPLDRYMKATVAHNLHHIYPNSHYFTIPYHHLIEGYSNDVAMYNRIYKTDIEF